MADKMAMKFLLKNYIFNLLLAISIVGLSFTSTITAKAISDQSIELQKEKIEINVSFKHAKDLKKINKIIKENKPKSIYIEQWILMEKGNEDLLKDLYKIAKKNNIKLFLFIGRNNWIGKRGLTNALASFEQYGNYIDGLVLRTQPDKLSVWKDDNLDAQAQILNLMLDAYSAIRIELKKKNKIFIAEFPFWYSDYKGPLKSFSETVCDYTDKIIFLIDNIDKFEKTDFAWNDVTCRYGIDLTKKATGPTIESVDDIYKIIKSKLTFYPNFNGYIYDSEYLSSQKAP